MSAVEDTTLPQAALSAGFTRIRPVIMTALAMIIGMIPMALAMGEGGEQNAPLGRAVIGGLLLATPTTLLFVPIVYSLVRKEAPVNLDRQISEEAGEWSAGVVPQRGRSEACARVTHGSAERHLAAVLQRPGRSSARRGARIVWLAALVLCLLAAGAFVAGYLPKRRMTEQLNAAAAKRRSHPPFVNSAKVKRAATTSELLLPGNITPITEAYIFARAAGYFKRRYVDIGDRVRADQLLAEIDAPDLDQQVSQARAALAQAEGQLGQARSDAAATHRDARSCRPYLAEIQGADRVRSGIPPGRRHAIDGGEDGRGECDRRRKVGARGGGICSRKQSRTSETGDACRDTRRSPRHLPESSRRATSTWARSSRPPAPATGPPVPRFGAFGRTQRRRDISRGGDRQTAGSGVGSPNVRAEHPGGADGEGHRAGAPESESSRVR